MSEYPFDVVIVGAGVAGSIMAKALTQAGKRVLVLEAGQPMDYEDYRKTWVTSLAKVPNSPYPDNPNARSQNLLDAKQIQANAPNESEYFVQKGPLPFLSDYTRSPGGTTLHWLGSCLRMLPNDFELKTQYGQAVDWPLSYAALRPYYEKAEWEIGVSADVEDQQIPGTDETFYGADYHYPMQKLPPSYLDWQITKGLTGMRVDIGDEQLEIKVISTPQGRNSTPNKDPNSTSNENYKPVGATFDVERGQRCEGNANCVPICPVQAKYNAKKSLRAANQKNLTVINRAVASQIEIDPESGRVTGITYKKYFDPESPTHITQIAKARYYVIAAHAVESAKLLLASQIQDDSDQLGRNLMDHPVLLAWGLMPENAGSFRGPGSTSNIPTFRDGAFRRQHSAWITPIDNWGWGWPEFTPGSTLNQAVDSKHLFGTSLRRHIHDQVPRQMNFHFEFELLPDSNNRVTIDSTYKDQLGNFRPVIRFDIPDYTCEAMAAARGVSRQMFARLGIEDHTQYQSNEPGYMDYNNVGYTFRGAGHLAGTHRMGFSKRDSVVDRTLRTWGHDNLYVVGAGSMPTIGTANPTLTVAALAFWAVDHILKGLK